jgi:hypothetical protein
MYEFSINVALYVAILFPVKRRDPGVYSSIHFLFLNKSHLHKPIPISYPNITSVVLPSQPLFPPVEIMNWHVGSRYNCEMTPVLWPGTMRNGTAAPRAPASSFACCERS